MNKKQRHHIEKRLLEERARVLRALRVVASEEGLPPAEASGDVSRWPTHLADDASDTEEQERDFIVAQRESELFRHIDEALRLLREDPKAFAKCERCGRAIEFERFDVIPWTRLCAPCAREEEIA
ncbi:MAG: TraR/DksA family transcriptional regulator [Gemmatimonadota bacterium]